MIQMPDKSKDIIEEAFRIGWESAVHLKDMINAQSEDVAIDNLRGVAYALYFDALHEHVIKENNKNEAVLDVLSLGDGDTQIKAKTPVPPEDFTPMFVDSISPCVECNQDPAFCGDCNSHKMWAARHRNAR